jgi:transcriptional regulator with XRE-family HTH domain
MQENINMIRNERIKALRNSLGLKQKEFALSVRVSEGLISKIEKGAVPVTDKMITKIALEYEINPEWLKGNSSDVRNMDAISDSQQLRRLFRYHRETAPNLCVDARLAQIDVLEKSMRDVSGFTDEAAGKYLKLLTEYFEKFYMTMYYLKTQNLSSTEIQVILGDLEEEMIKKLEAFVVFFSEN